MLQRILFVLLILGLAILVLPPTWYVLDPVPVPSLPPPGEQLEVAPGVSVNVLERGEGPPVVLVHGHPGTGYDWAAFQEDLAARGYRAIAYDRVGYGRSDGRKDDAFTLDRNASELLALLEAKDLRDVTLVGWSYGGGIAIVAAREDPSRIARLVLVGSIGPGIVEERQVAPPWLFDLVAPPVLWWIHHVPPVQRRLGALAAEAAFAPEPVAPGFRERAAANLAMPHTFESLSSEAKDLDTPGLLDPSDLEPPILVVHGDGDRFSPPKVGRNLHERARRSELWLVPGAGHMIPITRPVALAERVAALSEHRSPRP